MALPQPVPSRARSPVLVRWARGRRLAGWLVRPLLGLLCLGSLPPAWASPPTGATQQILFGPATYTRTGGPPNVFVETFPLPPTLTGPFSLHVQNGTREGRQRMSSATITLNGRQVAGPADFSYHTSGFDREVRLQARNTLQVRLTGVPRSFLVLTLYGRPRLPTLTRLEPPVLSLTPGATGTLRATISAAQSRDTRITLQSEDPDVARVPPAVIVPANRVRVRIPVTAGVPGTARITASLHGSRLQSTVTVTPAGPSLTSLSPGTLQVTQGASGLLTVTISAAPAHDTVISLTSSAPGIVGLPPPGSVTIPAGETQQAFAVFGISPGTSTVTATLHGSAVQSQVTVGLPAPTVVSLLPPTLPLTEGSQGTLTVTLNASQPTETDVFVQTSDPSVVGLPGDWVAVPANLLSTSFAVTGLARGLATVTVALNGSTATAAVSVAPPPPTVRGLTCPGPLTVGATTLCTVTLNATQLTETEVPLGSAEPAIVTVPGSVIVPANTLSTQFGATGITVGTTTVTAGPLNGTSQSVSIQVLPPPPTIVSLTPGVSSLFVGAAATLTLTLNAAQLEETLIPVASTPAGILSVPAMVTVPAGALAVPVTVSGLTPGTATLTAGLLNDTQAQSTLTVNQLPPTLTALTPPAMSLPKGTAGTLTVAITPTQPAATVVSLASGDPLTVEVPPSVTVPAGSATAAFPVLARAEGSALITAGPLNATSQSATVTVTPPELLSLLVAPPDATIAQGQTQPFTAEGTYTDGTTPDLTGSATWASGDQAVAIITTTGGLATAVAPGTTTITATVTATSHALGVITASASLTVTPPVLASLAMSPAFPSVLLGQTLQLSAVGTLTDGTTQDLTPLVTWTTSDPAVATLTSPGGLATTLTPGTTTITATHPEGFTASTTLTVVLPPPTITSFTPSSGKVGITVAITGANLGTTTGVAFNGTAASTFTVTNSTTITVTVPSGTTTGPIAVTAAGGTAASLAHFIVLPTYDFSLTVAPTTVLAVAGTSVGVSLRTVTTGGFTGLTQLNLPLLPAGVTAAFAPPALGPNATGVLTLTTTGSTPLGSAAIEVRGTAQVEGSAVTRTTTVSLTVQAPGQATLVGQVRDENDQPLPGVSIKFGWNPPTTLGVTDAGGNFLVSVPALGSLTVLLDGSTVGKPGVSYPTIPVTVTVQAGVVNTLGYVPRLVPQALGRTIPILFGQETVLAPADIPGLEVRIPAGITITGWDGQPNTEIGVVAVPLDRSGAPPLPGGLYAKTVYAYYFGKVGGGNPSQPVPITFPNDLGLSPGEQADLYYYDELPDGSQVNTWRKYGTGTVSSDGTKIVPDTDPSTGKAYGVPRFCCGYNTAARRWPLAEVNRGPYDAPIKAGEPVELQTGLFVLEKTDLVLPDRIPVVLRRTYRTNGYPYGPFGAGTSFDVNLILAPPANGSPDQLILRMPGDSLNPFVRQPDGSFVNTVAPIFRGARVTLEGDNRILRFKDGAVWTFRGSDGLLMAQTDRNGNTLTLERNATYGRITRIVGPTGRAISLRYSSDESPILEATDDTGRTVTYEYNGWQLLSVTDPAGGVTRYTYDANNRLRTITDPRGITFLTNEYDSAGRVIRQTQADGGVWQFAYTVTAGIITSTTVTDPRGNTNTSRFNASGYLISHTDALGQTTTYERAPGSNLILSTTDALGRVTQYTYDATGNVTAITDPLNHARTFTYDPTFNKVTSITDPLGNLTTLEYDGQGNLMALTDPLTNTTTITYNGYGQPLTTTDPLGNTTTFTYTTHGDLETITDPLGNTTTRDYDSLSRLIAQTDPLGRTTRFSYDPLNRLTGIVDALGGTTVFGYDANGSLVAVTDARGSTIIHEFDSMDRLSRRIDQLGRAETFNYDGNGNLTSTTDRKNQTSTFTYDPLNRRVRGEYADGMVAIFQYDAGDRLLSADDTADPHRPILRQYDPIDRLLGETTALGTVSYQYDALGRRTEMTVGGQAPVMYTYGPSSRLRTITQAPLNPVRIDYDAANRRTLLTLPNGVSTEYVYDSGSRLTGLVYRNALGPFGDLTYQYDPLGNRVGVGGSFARTLLPDIVPSATYDAANRQLAFGEKTMTFDDKGNLSTLTDPVGTLGLTWDSRNRLIALSGPTTGSFAYDALGRRGRWTMNERTVEFQYDGLDIIRERVPGLELTYLRSLSLDEAFARVETTGVTYYLAEALGSTLELLDGTGITSTWYTYEPYGRIAAAGAPTGNPYAYTGREADTEEFYFYRHRYYHSRLGRFVSEDPQSLVPGENRYVYAQNAPGVFLDPLGTWTLPGHQALTQRAMREVGGFSDHDIGLAEQGNAAVDYAYWNAETGVYAASEAHHYMPGTEAQAERIIRDKLNEATAREKAGQHDQAMQVLGEGLHTVQDKWAHSKQGAGWPEHIRGSGRYTDPDNPTKHPTEYRQAYEETKEYLEDFKRGRPRKPPRGRR